MNITNIENKLYSWVNSETGLTTIWEHENAPRPENPYLSLFIDSFNTINQDYKYMPENENDGIDIKGDREFTLRINCYGNNSLQILHDLRNSLEKPSVQYFLSEEQIIFVDRLAINNITGMLNTKYEKRSVMDLLFRTSDIFTDSEIEIIDEVNSESEYYNQDRTLIYENIINIS